MIELASGKKINLSEPWCLLDLTTEEHKELLAICRNSRKETKAA